MITPFSAKLSRSCKIYAYKLLQNDIIPTEVLILNSFPTIRHKDFRELTENSKNFCLGKFLYLN